MRAFIVSPWTLLFALVLLCAAYIQGGLVKLFDFPAAVAEQARFHVPWPTMAAAMTVVTELFGSALVVVGFWRWAGALLLAGFTMAANVLANAFWAMPEGAERMMVANGLFEHVGLVGSFLVVAVRDLEGRSR